VRHNQPGAFDADDVARHNADVIRLALAALVFCSTLCAAPGQMPAGLPDAPASSRAPAGAHAPLGCTPEDDDGEWRPQHEATASITESAWKWRTLHAAVAAIALDGAIVANVPADPPRARATGAPSYLLHIPLLI
jgi:hypothetical protein